MSTRRTDVRSKRYSYASRTRHLHQHGETYKASKDVQPSEDADTTVNTPPTCLVLQPQQLQRLLMAPPRGQPFASGVEGPLHVGGVTFNHHRPALPLTTKRQVPGPRYAVLHGVSAPSTNSQVFGPRHAVLHGANAASTTLDNKL